MFQIIYMPIIMYVVSLIIIIFLLRHDSYFSRAYWYIVGVTFVQTIIFYSLAEIYGDREYMARMIYVVGWVFSIICLIISIIIGIILNRMFAQRRICVLEKPRYIYFIVSLIPSVSMLIMIKIFWM